MGNTARWEQEKSSCYQRLEGGRNWIFSLVCAYANANATIIPTLTLGLRWRTEDYTATAAKAIATPFRLEQCVKIAESQLNGASPLSPGDFGPPFRVN